MPLIQVSLIEGRPKEKISELIESITNTAAETLDAPVETIRVLVNEVPSTHWGIAGRPASEKRLVQK